LCTDGLAPAGDKATHNIRTWRATEAAGPWEGHPLGFGVLSTYPRVRSPVFGSAMRPSCMVPTDGPGPAIQGPYPMESSEFKRSSSAYIGVAMRDGAAGKFYTEPTMARFVSNHSPFPTGTMNMRAWTPQNSGYYN